MGGADCSCIRTSAPARRAFIAVRSHSSLCLRLQCCTALGHPDGILLQSGHVRGFEGLPTSICRSNHFQKTGRIVECNSTIAMVFVILYQDSGSKFMLCKL